FAVLIVVLVPTVVAAIVVGTMRRIGHGGRAAQQRERHRGGQGRFHHCTPPRGLELTIGRVSPAALARPDRNRSGSGPPEEPGGSGADAALRRRLARAPAPGRWPARATRRRSPGACGGAGRDSRSARSARPSGCPRRPPIPPPSGSGR